jgi:ribonuclease BN (tRNA processing enzyme)
MATEVAAAAGVKQLILTHHDPLCDDETLEETERLAQGAFVNCQLAREGMTIEL